MVNDNSNAMFIVDELIPQNKKPRFTLSNNTDSNASTNKGFDLDVMHCMKSDNDVNPVALQPFFENLPIDPHVKTSSRFRRLSKFQFTSDDGFVTVPHGSFVQSSDYNPLVGDVERQFDDLNEDLIHCHTFQSLLRSFRDMCTLRPGSHIGVHQIRTTCSPDSVGEVVPEGIHQDGADFVCIYVVDRDNIEGAETFVYNDKQGDSTVFHKVLNPGEMVLLNDRKFYHYTSSIRPARAGTGRRDVFVLTYPSLMGE
jgi:hypothetical protein